MAHMVTKKDNSCIVAVGSPLVLKPYAIGDDIRWSGSAVISNPSVMQLSGSGFFDAVQFNEIGLYRVYVHNKCSASVLRFDASGAPVDSSLLSVTIQPNAQCSGLYVFQRGTTLKIKVYSGPFTATASDVVYLEVTRVTDGVQDTGPEYLADWVSVIGGTLTKSGSAVAGYSFEAATASGEYTCCFSIAKCKVPVGAWVSVLCATAANNCIVGFSTVSFPDTPANNTVNGICCEGLADFFPIVDGLQQARIGTPTAGTLLRMRRATATSAVAETSTDKGYSWITIQTLTIANQTQYVYFYLKGASSVVSAPMLYRTTTV